VNLYIAQTAAGSGNGADCADALPVSFFNTAANWGASAGQIGPGTTVHLCGVISTPLTAQGSGTSSNPLTLYFEAGAKLSAPVCPFAGCLNIDGKSYVTVNGGTNGIIENTANGKALANKSNSQGISGISSNNIEIKNLTIQNIYVTSAGSVDTDQTLVRCISFSGSHWSIHDNVMHDVGWCLFQQYGNGDTDIQIFNNDISDMDHGWMLAASGPNAITNVFFHDNKIHDTAAWDAAGCPAHHDGVHMFGIPSGSAMSNVYVSNNYFYGSWGTCPTGFVFVEAAGSGTPAHLSNSYWWNNVGVVSNSPIVNTNGWFGISSGDSGVTQVYNNTLVGPNNTDNTLCFNLQNLTNLSFKNNVASNCGDPVYIANSTLASLDENFYGPVCGNGGNCFVWNGSFTGSFANWKQAIGGGFEANSVQNNNALLNADGSPQAGSPVIGLGTNLMSLATGNLSTLASDTSEGNTRTPIARPASGAWDAGAYEYAGNTSVAGRTFYIDFASGSDANNGTSKTTPWQRAPGMNGFAGSYAHQAGDQFIFKGGVTWPNTALQLSIGVGGTSSNPDYYGVSPSYFSGGSWTRPIFDAGGSTVSPSNAIISINSTSWIIIDDIEIKNLWATGAQLGEWSINVTNSNNVTVKNCYVHDWNLSTYTVDGNHFGGISVNPPDGPGSDGNNTIAFNTVGPGPSIVWGTKGDSFGNFGMHNSNASAGIGIDGAHFASNNTVHDLPNGFNGTWVTHDNLIYNIRPSIAEPTLSHENGAYLFPRTTNDVYNNVMHDVCCGTAYYLEPGFNNGAGSPAVFHVYDNVFYQGTTFGNNGGNPFPTPFLVENENSAQAGTEVDLYNNTLQCGSGGCVRVTSIPVPPNTMRIQNNLWITDNGTPVSFDSAQPPNLIQDHNLLMSNATATTQGYVAGNNYAPTATSNVTVGAGTNLTSLGISSLDSDIRNVTRPGSGAWDAGAYQFSGSGGDTTPPTQPTGLSASAVSSSQINLSWTASTDNVGVTGYQIYRSGNLVGTSASTGYSDIGLTASTLYSYTVAAYDAAGNISAQSISASATTQAGTAPGCSLSNASWLNASFTSQSGSFTASFDATPNQNSVDGVIGLSLGAASAYANLSAIVRFNNTGTIDVMNASAYSAAVSIPYTAGSTYHVRMVVDPSVQTYSVYVTPPASSEVQIAGSYGFRTTALVSSLNNLGTVTSAGDASICNFSATASGGGTTPPSVTNQPQSLGVLVGQNATFTVTASGTVPLSYQWQGQASGASSFTDIAGATSSYYTRSAVPLSDNGLQIQCVVTNSAGSATSSAATLTVTAAVAPPPPPPGSPLPLPQISFPTDLPLSGTLSILNISAYSGVTFQWSFQPLSNASVASGGAFNRMSAVSASGVVFKTQAGGMQPVTAGLSVGTYQVSVVAIDGSGNQSPAATGQITLVSTDLSGVQVYPNPWRSDQHAAHPTITFANLPLRASIKIFTVSGRLARDLGTVNGNTTWDLTNDSADKVASGIYIYLITDPQGNKVRGKVGVIR